MLYIAERLRRIYTGVFIGQAQGGRIGVKGFDLDGVSFGSVGKVGEEELLTDTSLASRTPPQSLRRIS